jgi:hypothetical protein
MNRRILEKLASGRGVKSICKELKIGKCRVRTVRAKGIELEYLSGDGKSLGVVPVPPPPENVFSNFVDRRSQKTGEIDLVLLSHKDWIADRLSAKWSPITIFEELKLTEGSKSSFYRFLYRHDFYKSLRVKPSLVAPIVHAPGEALILDWGKIKNIVDKRTGEIKTLWAFVGVMGFSRYMSIRLVWTNSVEVTMDAIESMLSELGGVPVRVTSDNPKCFSIKADKHEPTLNPSFERLAAHYNFRIECLPPREPKKKGKVERMMPYVRRLFEAYSCEDFDLVKAQEYMNKKCGLANERRHGTTDLRPIEVFLQEEVQALKPLPKLAYEKEEISYATVRRDGFVRFENKYYAVADEHINKTAVVLGSKTRVSIFIFGVVVESYDRLISKHQTHAIHNHLEKPWQKTLENNEGYLRRAGRVGPSCEAVVRVLILRNSGFIDTRIIWGILSLDKKYDVALIEWACAEAYDLGKFSSKYIEKIILERMKAAHLSQNLEFKKHPETAFTKSSIEYSRYIENLINKPDRLKTIH